jgi:hypothetical protein
MTMSVPPSRCLTPWRPGQAGHEHVALVEGLDDVRRRHAERVGEQPHRRGKAHLQQGRGVACGVRAVAGDRQPAAVDVVAEGVALLELGDAVLLEEVGHEAAVLHRHLGDELAAVEAAVLRRLVVAGEQQIDAERRRAELALEPRELALELVGGQLRGAEHAEPAGARHRDDHALAVREGQQRMLDAEHHGDRGAHRTTICARRRALRLAQAIAEGSRPETAVTAR